MTRDPHGSPPDPRTVRRPAQPPPAGAYQPVEPPPTVKQRVQPPAAAPPSARPPELDPDRWGYNAFAPPPPVAPAGPVAVPPGAAARGAAARSGPSGRAWIALIVAILVAAAAIVVAIVLTGDDPVSGPPPVAVVQTYLRDLAAHDASDALAQGKAPASRAFLSDDILRRQQNAAPISNVRVGSASVKGDHARVPAQYRFGIRSADVSFALTRTDGKWLLDQTTFRIDVSMLATVPAATVFGKPVGGVRSIEVFPGPVMWGSGNKYFAVNQKNADRYALSPTDPNASYAEISAGLNTDGVAALRSAAAAYVKSCADSHSLRPSKCPQEEYGQGAIKNTASWTVTTPLNPALRYKPSDEDLTTVMLDAKLRWTCVYSVRAAGGGTRRLTDRTVQADISGSVDLTAAKPVFTASI